jgi:2-polyprenyl-6-methoxyphenol hydroxylase-like FAD-dependent oxidoreductase
MCNVIRQHDVWVLHVGCGAPTLVGMTSSIAVVGGGPGGLFLATLVARGNPAAAVTVYERNRRTDAFGFGVVFSDATLRAIDDADPVLRDALRDYGTHWDRIDVRSDGERHSFAGNGMAAIHRRTLLRLLQDNAEAAGVAVRYGSEAPPVADLAATYDLVVGADGANSTVRAFLEQRAALGHEVATASAKFIWFGTEHLFDGLTFLHRQSEHGNFAVHAYPISAELSTFIVETDPDTWSRAGLERFDVAQPPGPSDELSQTYLAKLFADDIDGARLVANNSRWANFRTRRTRRWFSDNVVLLGDAVHTAHFSVGSGTKMAMEDAVELARQLAGSRDLPAALRAYQEARAPGVARIQAAAVPSLAWWERFGRYQRDLDPFTFAFHFFSRSITVDKIAQRDPDLVATARARWAQAHGRDALHTPLTLVGHQTRGRVLRLVPDADRLWLEENGRRLVGVPSGSGPEMVAVATAPASDKDVTRVADDLPAQGTVVITGGTALTRTLLSEEARLSRGLVSIVVDDLSDAAVETALLAGRVDAVARPAEPAP